MQIQVPPINEKKRTRDAGQESMPRTLGNQRVQALPIATKIQNFEKSSPGQTKHFYLTHGPAV